MFLLYPHRPKQATNSPAVRSGEFLRHCWSLLRPGSQRRCAHYWAPPAIPTTEIEPAPMDPILGLRQAHEAGQQPQQPPGEAGSEMEMGSPQQHAEVAAAVQPGGPVLPTAATENEELRRRVRDLEGALAARSVSCGPSVPPASVPPVAPPAAPMVASQSVPCLPVHLMV